MTSHHTPVSRHRKKPGSADAVEPPLLTGVALLLSETPAGVVDLHGYTAPQTEARVRDFVLTHARISRGRVVHIITGKGTRSEGQPVLPGVVQELLGGSLARHVAEVAGLPGGGGFALRLHPPTT